MEKNRRRSSPLGAGIDLNGSPLFDRTLVPAMARSAVESYKNDLTEGDHRPGLAPDIPFYR